MSRKWPFLFNEIFREKWKGEHFLKKCFSRLIPVLLQNYRIYFDETLRVLVIQPQLLHRHFFNFWFMNNSPIQIWDWNRKSKSWQKLRLNYINPQSFIEIYRCSFGPIIIVLGTKFQCLGTKALRHYLVPSTSADSEP